MECSQDAKEEVIKLSVKYIIMLVKTIGYISFQFSTAVCFSVTIVGCRFCIYPQE